MYPQTRDICLASRQGLGPGHAPWGGGATLDRLSLPAGTWHAAQSGPQLVPHQRVGATEVDRARPAPGPSRSLYSAAGGTGARACLPASHPGPRCCRALKLLPGFEGRTPEPSGLPDPSPHPRLDPHSTGPHHGPQRVRAVSLRHQEPTRLWLEMPAAPGPFPQGGLRVTHCDEEEDTEAGLGPGRAALVSLLGSQPLRQVQETDRQGAAGLAPAGPWGCGPLDSGRREHSQVGAAAGGAGSAGVGWGGGSFWPLLAGWPHCFC